MKFNKAILGGVAFAAAASMTLAACSSDEPADNGSSSPAESGGASDAIILTNGSEPENPLVPGNTGETGGGKIVDAIFSGLVYYDASGASHNEVAESITQIDPQHFEIKLQDGWTFTNGEPVNAESFVNAWNYTALASNAQYGSYFFEDFEGHDYENDSELGLTIVDDLTFEVALNKPAADFAQRLGYAAYFPLPQAFFDDPEGFGENPVGNGPYMLDGEGAWQHDVQIDLVVNPDYAGERVPANGGLRFTFFESQDAYYAALLGGDIDVIDGIPDSALATYETDLEGRSVNQAAAIFQSFTIAQDLEHFGGEEGKLRRAALSMSINRQEITDVIYQGTRTPASDFTSPVVSGWTDSLSGAEVLDYNPEAAVELWAQADAISPFEGQFKLAYNADGGHQAWVDAVTNSIKNTLGIDAVGEPVATFADFRTRIGEGTIGAAFRTGWQADYPGLYNFLGPLYGTGAGANDGGYSSEAFDAALSEGISIADEAERNAKLQEAQETLLEDLPAIPLWYSNVNGGYAANVENVEFGWNSVPVYENITKN